MPKICYTSKRFGEASITIIDQANEIITEYSADGFDLTLRQLYYQFVSRRLIANKQQEYKRLGGIINDARLAGLIDWRAIVDRTRNVRKMSHWDNESDIIMSCVHSFAIDKWENQRYRPQCWIEKDALIGVIADICKALDIPYFSCRGYTSQSEMWSAGQRLISHARAGQVPYIIHLGDHDPSGIDMSRDIEDRLALFMKHEGYPPTEFKRIALNIDQVHKYGPPPNPTKLTDSRAKSYIIKHGYESWELDALNPSTLADLISNTVLDLRDDEQWDEDVRREKEGRELLKKVAYNWDNIVESL